MSYDPRSNSIELVLPEGAVPAGIEDGKKPFRKRKYGWQEEGMFAIPFIEDITWEKAIEANLVYRNEKEAFQPYYIQVVNVETSEVIPVQLSVFRAFDTAGLKKTAFEQEIIDKVSDNESLIKVLTGKKFATMEDFHGNGQSRFFRLHEIE